MKAVNHLHYYKSKTLTVYSTVRLASKLKRYMIWLKRISLNQSVSNNTNLRDRWCGKRDSLNYFTRPVYWQVGFSLQDNHSLHLDRTPLLL